MIGIQNEPRRYEGVEFRVQFLALGLVLVFLAPLHKLWQLQVVNQSEYQGKADSQRIWETTLESDRGIIYGKDDVILADNRASVNVVFVPGECPEVRREEVCIRLAKILGLNPNNVLEKVKNNAGNPFEQVLIKNDVTKTELFHIEENSFDLPGVLTLVRPQRRYLYGNRRPAAPIPGRNQPQPARRPLLARSGLPPGRCHRLGGSSPTTSNSCRGRMASYWSQYARAAAIARGRGGMPAAKRDSVNGSAIEGQSADQRGRSAPSDPGHRPAGQVQELLGRARWAYRGAGH